MCFRPKPLSGGSALPDDDAIGGGIVGLAKGEVICAAKLAAFLIDRGQFTVKNELLHAGDLP